MEDKDKLLKTMFLIGAGVDAAALIPMLWPWAARMMWGYERAEGEYRYAMGYGAALMAGWTSLLVWASRKPAERRCVALLTMQVVLALVVAEIAAVRRGTISAKRMGPTWVMQAVLSTLFAKAYVRSLTRF